MANSKYEYVKSFENEDEVMYPNLIVVRIHARNFERFSEINQFKKPNDERALNLMNCCATSVLEKYPDIILAYGFRDEYNFIFKKETKFYQRRASKMLSLIVSFFESLYAEKWREFFPHDMRSSPSFKSRVICCPSVEVLQTYLAWRQRECHSKNLYNTCLWMLIKSGKSETEAHKVLEGAQKREKNEILFQQFGINYKNLPSIYRQGSCVLKTEVDDTLKIHDNVAPVRRSRKKVIVVHSENIASKTFWDDYSCLCKEISRFEQNVNKIRQEYVRSFRSEIKLLQFTWIVIRIDGSHFHRFTEVHGFEKPNDEQALKLMNTCAVAVLEEFNEIVFAYGVSDEYSFVLRRNSQLYQRRASEIVSAIVAFFSSSYVMKWKEFFPKKELKYPPNFDGRAVCYPSYEIIRDYLAWRQVDCHINNQYNTCFWMLVKSGKSTREAQSLLKGTQTQEKNQMLSQLFGIDYNMLPIIFRNGSCVFWDKETMVMRSGVVAKSHKKVVVEHSNIIEDDFWEAHPLILEEMSLRSQTDMTIKSFENENEDEVMYPNLIVVRIDGHNFKRFSEINDFEKPNDERALNLMNCCATLVLEKHPDIILAYGFRDEYSFIFKKETKFCRRHASKMLSLILGFFASLYVSKWREFFPHQDMKSTPSFESRVICCPSMEVLQAYLAWRQRKCHSKNQYNTCLWMLIKSGKSEIEAHEVLKETQKQEKNEILFQQFGINYKNLPSIYRQGSCVLKTEVDDTLKIHGNEVPVRRLRKKVIIVHSENIVSTTFWNNYSCLCKEISCLEQNVNNIKQEYVKSFQSQNKLLPSTWIVIRIDCSHSCRFSKVHGFEKPNDEQALKLMNSCAVAVLEEYNDIVFAYGVSDEYSFVLRRNTQLYQRRASNIVSATISFFSSTYVMRWKEFFPKKELKYPPNFDGRATIYPSYEIIRGYLAWRQDLCHRNNHFNTCFWELVKSGKSKSEAHNLLKGTKKEERNQMLSRLFRIDYNTLPIIFRNGCSIFWDKETKVMDDGVAKSLKKVVVEHLNIIEDDFWEAHPLILEETSPRSQTLLF